ncbi:MULTISPECIES: hypothetical protein [Klebsiella]|uniref:Zinc ribbon domain-containing protein n=1 Tax=Klebsiella michiganensis TaxID=1134687 RepID=A0AB35WGJ0_9ENTR|nr:MULTISPECIES: hypothetical protein [Klebsiella]EKV5144918.1 hypothetical protein [Klebsiella michiganensis]ELT9738815.1 hypothetical protein [Klebsiella michiganensis]MBZ7766965.1 hypothetical protein [Klebsiella michiganensis]MDS7809800.1 hypothetical protein [Klebsiella michiganensis]MEC5933652.1 hypothetical protein [Klebsiella pneumoniae]
MSMTTCRKCGSEVRRSEKKCPYCEASNPAMRWWRPVIFLAVLVALLKACSYIPDPDPADLRDKGTTLKQWRSMLKDDRLKFIDSYLAQEKIITSDTSGFYKCISQQSFTKNDEIKVDEALNWCKQDYLKNPSSLYKMIDFDTFIGNTRGFDNSYIPITNYIKNNMHDPSSFKHLETRYRFVMNDSSPYAVVTTIYQGKNNYGVTVKNQITAKVDLISGLIVNPSN